MEEEESSPCRVLRQSEVGFQSMNPLPNRSNLLGRREYTRLVGGLHPCSSHSPPIEIQYTPDGTPVTRLCPKLVYLQFRALLPSSPSSFPGGG